MIPYSVVNIHVYFFSGIIFNSLQKFFGEGLGLKREEIWRPRHALYDPAFTHPAMARYHDLIAKVSLNALPYDTMTEWQNDKVFIAGDKRNNHDKKTNF